jgi:excisionase family DNA binding protein
MSKLDTYKDSLGEGQGMSELLTLPETARRLGVGETWLWQQTARGNLRTVRLPGGRLVRIREEDLRQFVEAHLEGGDGSAAGDQLPAALNGSQGQNGRESGREFFERRSHSGDTVEIGYRKVLENQDHPAVGTRAYQDDVTVTVYGPRTAFGAPVPAEINWSALGSVSVEQAVEYADLLLKAIKIASGWPT